MEKPTIIFDFFGVLSSSVLPFWFQKYFPLDEATRLKDLYCPSADSGTLSEKEWFETMAQLVKKTPTKVRKEFGSCININDRVVALIKTLKSTCTIGLCSNTIGSYLRTLLEHYGLTELFDAMIFSSECGWVKPDPEIFRLLLQKLSARAENAVFIDDTIANVEAARRMGMKGIVFSGVRELYTDLENLGIKIPVC